MRARNFSNKKSLTTQSGGNINVALRGSLYGQESQIRQSTQLVGFRGDKRPTGLKENDVTVRPTTTGVAVGISDSKGNVQEVIVPADFSGYASYQEGSGVPTVAANFPDDGAWGWYYDTGASALYWVRNREGTLLKPHFLGLSGSLQTGQHGDRSAEVATMHGFTQVSGTITDAQHGNRGSGSLHDVVTITVAGFMTASDKVKLNDATSAATASTLALRNASGGINFAGIDGTIIDASTDFRVDNVKVVGNRNTGWTAFTGTTDKATAYATGTVTHVELAERVAAIQVALTTHGLLGA